MSAKNDGGRVLFGVRFTPEEWAATNTHPPLWHLHPPQREVYDGDKEYAEAELAYAQRVLSARSAPGTKEGGEHYFRPLAHPGCAMRLHGVAHFQRSSKSPVGPERPCHSVQLGVIPH